MRAIKTMKKMLSCALLISLPGYAEILNSKKESEEKKQSWFDNAYSSVMLRTYQTKEADKDFSGIWQGRLTFGSTFLNKKLLSQVVFGLEQKTGTATIEDRGTWIETVWSPYSNDYYSVDPFAYVSLPKIGKSKANVQLGVDQSIFYNWKTGSAGDFKFKIGYYFSAYFGSKPGEVNVENGLLASSDNREKLGLKAEKDDAGKENITAEKKSPTLEHSFTVATAWKAPFAKGFTVDLKRHMYLTMNQAVKYNEVTKEIDYLRGGFLNLPVYDTSYLNMNRLIVAYKFDNGVKLSAEGRLYDDLNYKVVGTVSTKIF